MPRALKSLLLLLLFSGLSPAAEQWFRLNSPHFELYTTAGEKKGRELILYFEQVRSFFGSVWPSKGTSEFPARIVVFRSEKQYRPYAPSEVAAAFYTPGRYRDYIVLSDTDPEHLPAAIHEYMHLVIKHSGLTLPLWLNEGWADLYSTLKPIGRKAMVGDLLPGRVQTLQQQKWMSFDELTSTDHKSAAYNEKTRAGIFYSESWALVHMLYLTPEYGPKFAAFITAVNQGKTAAEACQIAYGRTSGEVFADLQNYFRRNRLFGATFDVKLSKSEEEADASQPAEFESETVLADLLSVTNKREQASEAFRKLAAAYPDKPEIPQSMGYLAWQNGDSAAARADFEKAFALGAKDPQMCYHLGMLEMERDAKAPLAIEALRRATEQKPDYTEARLQLGLAQLNAKDFEGALASLSQIHKTDPEHAPTLFNALAYGYVQTGNFEEARKQAELARKYDKTASEKERTENLLTYLDARANQMKAKEVAPPGVPASDDAPAPPRLTRTETMPRVSDLDPRMARNPFVKPGEKIERVEGTAKTFDCEGKRFVIESAGKVMAFDMPDPERIQIRHNSDVTVDFTCGPQKPVHMAIEFAPGEKIGKDSMGAMRAMEF